MLSSRFFSFYSSTGKKNLQLLISNLEEGRDEGMPYYSLLIKRYFDGKCKNISYNQIIELNVPEQCAY